MTQRIFKRKSDRTSVRNYDLNTEEFKAESLTSHSSNENDANSTKCVITIPNRIFVGGLNTCTDEWDIRTKFSKYGQVKNVKIIRDNMGNSKGYGFITFSTKEEAKNILGMAQIYIKGRKLNIGPAVVKKQTNQLDSLLTETSSADSSNDGMIRNHHKQNTSKYMEYSSSTFSTNMSYSFETPGCLDATMLQNCPENSNGNSQVNCILSYPTLVYVSQYPCQYPVGIAYSTGTNFPDMMPLIAVPATFCCTNGELQG